MSRGVRFFVAILREFTAGTAAYLTCVKEVTGAMPDIYRCGPFVFQASQTMG
jgi:hypothetical protein